jgi:hypothetical protein
MLAAAQPPSRACDAARATASLAVAFGVGGQTKRLPETGDLDVPDSDGCGGPQPAEFGVLLDRGLRRPQFRRRPDILPRDT